MTRTWLVLICVVLVLLLLLGMRLGWRNRTKRQAYLPVLPTAPAELGAELLTPMLGVYVGSTFADNWQDRVVHDGLGRRASSTISFHEAGLNIQRYGDRPIFIPLAWITGAELRPGIAGKVMGAGGLLVVSWRLTASEDEAEAGEFDLDTGIRADDKSKYPEWVRLINAKAGVK
ncbi:MAG TPA: transporter [Jatrophihabitans sp.]|jgi:hypothetical protein